MKTLSEFLTEYLKEHLFNGTSLDKPETFDDQMKRVIHEGIYMYRKSLAEFQSARMAGKTMRAEIFNALIQAENEDNMRFIRIPDKSLNQPKCSL